MILERDINTKKRSIEFHKYLHRKSSQPKRIESESGEDNGDRIRETNLNINR